MKENALAATESKVGGARFALDCIEELARKEPALELHLVGHSAGSIFHAPIVSELRRRKLPVATCTLWAPAITTALFKEHYLPSVRKKHVGRLAVFDLTDRAERDDDCAKIYNKSLLYLVSNALETVARNPLPVVGRPGTPLLGMERSIRDDADLAALFAAGGADLVLAPNAAPEGGRDASTARSHGSFDDDAPTVASTLARILTAAPATAAVTVPRPRRPRDLHAAPPS
jgi:hypothetical protein